MLQQLGVYPQGLSVYVNPEYSQLQHFVRLVKLFSRTPLQAGFSDIGRKSYFLMGCLIENWDESNLEDVDVGSGAM